jgi:hypothetical protein
MKSKLLKSIILLFAVFQLNAQSNAPVSTTDGTLTVTFSTNNAGNTSYTEYVADIYITNSANALVNTLLYRTSNSNGSGPYLTNWWPLVGKSLTAATTKTTADAITGATAKSSSFYTNQNVYWGKLASVAADADGLYIVHFEICNVTSGGGGLVKHSYSGSFTKGPANSSAAVTTTANTGFSGINLSWVPVNTAIQDIEMQKLYSVYPNPAINSIYVLGTDITSIDICSLSGKVLIQSNEQSINVSKLPKGAYLAVIYIKTGKIVKKILKL